MLNLVQIQEFEQQVKTESCPIHMNPLIKTDTTILEKTDSLEEVTDPITGKPTLQLASLFKNSRVKDTVNDYKV